MKSIFTTLFVVVVAVMMKVSAQAPIEVPNSHLTCRKGLNLNEKYLFKAKVYLFANQFQQKYTLNKCKVISKRAELCVPSTKSIITTTAQYPYNYLDSTVVPQELKNDFICYPLNCKPQLFQEYERVADQFGYKRIRFSFKFRLCVPAWKLDATGAPILLG